MNSSLDRYDFWNTTEDSLISACDNDINEHLTWWYVLQICIISIISISIIVGNIINLLVLLNVRQMAWASRTFFINLSISDLSVGVIACAPVIYPSVTGCWPYGEAWCQISGIVHGTSVTISIWSISMVGVERYLATTKPFRYQSMINPKRCYIIIFTMWFVAILTFLAPNFISQNFVYYKYNSMQKICGLHWEYPAFCVVTSIYIPFLSGGVLIYTSVNINRVLSKCSNSANLLRTRDTRIAISKKTFRVLVVTSIAYFACWGPYVIMVLTMATLALKPPQWLQFLTMWAANSNSAINVCIYSSTNKHFRNAAKGLLQQFLCQGSGNMKMNSMINDSQHATVDADNIAIALKIQKFHRPCKACSSKME